MFPRQQLQFQMWMRFSQLGDIAMVNRWLSGVLIVLIGGSAARPSMAQSYPDCPPPASDEYLLFVRADDEATRDRTISVLPVDNPITGVQLL